MVADSVPELEWRETEAKARALLRAAELVEEGLLRCCLMIDNYDSFTFNLVQYFGELGEDGARVPQRRDRRRRASPRCAPDALVLLARAVHAGRGRRLRRRRSAPSRASCRSSASASATRRSAPRSAARWFAPQRLMHGKADVRQHTTAAASTPALPERFCGDPLPLAGASSASRCRRELEITVDRERRRDHGRSPSRAGRRPKTPLEGVQFHPESILTEHGHAMLKNFLEAAR